MKILIFRHGIAEDPRPGLPDPQRQMTREGYNRTRMATVGLTRLIRPVDVVLTSPWTRAEQAAAVLGIAMRRTPVILPELAGDRPAQDAINALFQREDTSVAIVGHNPQLEEIAALLCGAAADQRLTPVKKAGAVLLHAKDYPDHPAELRWAVSPRTLRMLAARLPRKRPPYPVSKVTDASKSQTDSPQPPPHAEG